VKTECANLLREPAVNFLVCTQKPWLAAISHPKPSIVLSHSLSRLASRKDCKPAVRDCKPRLWRLAGLAPAYSVRALRMGEYACYNLFVCGPKFITCSGCEDTPTNPAVIGSNTLNFRPNFKFSRSKVLLGTPSPFGCLLSRLGQSLARIKI